VEALNDADGGEVYIALDADLIEYTADNNNGIETFALKSNGNFKSVILSPVIYECPNTLPESSFI